jgi:hypothetical protein
MNPVLIKQLADETALPDDFMPISLGDPITKSEYESHVRIPVWCLGHRSDLSTYFVICDMELQLHKL